MMDQIGNIPNSSVGPDAVTRVLVLLVSDFGYAEMQRGT
jgi:hypothetical protein